MNWEKNHLNPGNWKATIKIPEHPLQEIWACGLDANDAENNLRKKLNTFDWQQWLKFNSVSLDWSTLQIEE